MTAIGQSSGKMTQHIVTRGETLFSIAKKYHVTVDALEKANKALGHDVKIKLGQTINIPTASKVEAKPKPEGKPLAAKPTPTVAITYSKTPSSHTIVKGESLYSLSKTYGVTVNQLKEANHLGADNKLSIGQTIIIPSTDQEAMYVPAPKEAKPEPKHQEVQSSQPGREYLPNDNTPTKPSEPPVRVIDEKPAGSMHSDQTKEPKTESVPEPKPSATDAMKATNVPPSEYTSVFSSYEGSSKKKVMYRGIASFLKSENPGNQYLALYNFAEMGSILKVTNLMSKQIIFVKVIGKIPAADTQSDIILKVSAEAASQLKVSEDKFLVEVTGYSAP